MAGKGGKNKNRRVVKSHELYDGAKLKRKTCPKCGAGYFLAEHKDRRSCGKCGYTEFNK